MRPPRFLYRDPETLEDAAALPYADIFLPGHNLESLDQPAAALAGALRPARHDALRNKL